ncbi:hypothetical protein ACN6LA_005868, partial [Streptomyces sp. SAS_269]
MAELVYRPVIGLAKTLFKAWDLKIDCQGSENIPRSGAPLQRTRGLVRRRWPQLGVEDDGVVRA